MRLTFVAPSTRHPSGGVAVIYEMATALAKRGHEVHLFHVNFFEGTASTIEQVGWFSFPGQIKHQFVPPDAAALELLPSGDAIFGFSFDSQMPPHVGLPAVLIQGYKMLGDAIERHAFQAPCPKICVAGWLVDVGRELGVPGNEIIHVPIGIHHDRYRVTRPIAGRPLQISFCYSAHAQKGPDLAIEVLAKVKHAVPDLRVTAFGARPPTHAMPGWVTCVTQPSTRRLVDDTYNASSVFLCTSRVEGFGLANVEAMACGAALVTTDNGGSRDYAFHDKTALVAPYGEVEALSGHVIALLEDDNRRVSVATAGRDYVRRFDWDRTGELLDTFLERYVAEPAAYGHHARRG
jgi:glycosyltransferase involved in cell wall biosynthesis